MDALILLVGRRGQLISKAQLQVEVWRGLAVTNSAIEQTIHRIRSALGDSREMPIFVETVQGDGYRFIADVVEVRVGSEDSLEDVGGAPDEESEGRRLLLRGLRARVALSWIVGILGLAGIFGVAMWGLRRQPSRPSSFAVSGRTLSVFDDQMRLCWKHTFDAFPGKGGGQSYPQILFSDFDGDGLSETLFVYAPLDERGVPPASSNAELYCFSATGRVKWTLPFGTEFRTPTGRSYPAALYSISLLGRLRKPRKDGGVIVAGGHLGGTWVYEVEIYTAGGKRVGSYLHPGWMYDMAITDINGDGVEEIVLGGVNNGFGEQGYAATLVVLDSRKVEGQGSTPPGDDRRALGRKADTAVATILLADFVKRLNENAYCAVHSISIASGLLELKVTQQSPNLPFVYFRFDEHLHLTSVQPELNFEEKLIKGLPGYLTNLQRQDFLMKRLGALKIIRNEFDPSFDTTRPIR